MTELLEYEYNGQTFIATLAEFIDELRYANYRYNRRITPLVTIEEWRSIFGDATDAMEARFQAEAAHR